VLVMLKLRPRCCVSARAQQLIPHLLPQCFKLLLLVGAATKPSLVLRYLLQRARQQLEDSLPKQQGVLPHGERMHLLLWVAWVAWMAASSK